MLTLLLVIFLILSVVLIWKENLIGALTLVASIILGFYCADCWFNISTGYIIAEKIEMYEGENSKIESSIEDIVYLYMDYEEETFTKLKDSEDVINLVSLFPELKTDTLVQQQISVYIANSDKIKELKEEQINLSKDKWLLYFGR